ncbi:MAG: response regulator [Candidatus Rokubacteria bacterium]|nr:response regulator [Candidatus Rokubacteria bacterium]
MRDASGADDRILVLAPPGRDTPPVASVLAEARLHAEHCEDVDVLAMMLEAGAGAAVMTDEALGPPGSWRLVEVVRRQPPWSDVPLLVLTTGGPATGESAAALRALEESGNVTLLERPVHVATLLSAIRAALRARRRQYEVRDHLAERRRAESEREQLLARERAARAEVEAANRAKDEFLAVLSHELRTPLQPILGWVKLLRQQPVDAATIRRGLETIERNARMQAQIVEDLLDVSRVIAGKLRLELRPVSLVPVIDAVLDAVRQPAASKAIAIETAFPGGNPIIYGDANRLQQIVWNLVSNAIAFTPEHGRVSVRVERSATDACVHVIDTGEGIPAHFLPHIFERFRQADSTSTRRHGGLGLGLAIVRHLVELHGGTVRADSPGEGLGATFTVTLPLVSQPAGLGTGVPAGTTPSARATGALSLAGLSILVVDDDADTCDLLSTVLGYYGADVRSASSAEEALRLVDERPPSVLVSDIAMPGIDGYELVRRVRAMEKERGWRIAALALTAHARASDTEQAFIAGFEAYIAKPVEPAELAQAIVKLAPGREPAPQPR